MDNADITAIMPEENIYKVAYPSTVKIVNGQLVYIMLDISKPVNTFLDLRQYFNGGQGDHGNVLPLMFAQNGRPLNTAGYTVKMRGAYPDGTAFELTADQSGSGNAIFNFNFLPGFFQTVGRYTFQIELDNGTNKLSSKVCFFDVEPNLLSVAMDFVDGVSPFDNEYEEWKAKVEREINQLEEEIATLMATASDCKALLNQYLKQAQEFVDAAVAKALKDVPKLDGDNTFTGTNTFNGNVRGKNITADNFNGNFNGNLNAQNVDIIGGFKFEDDILKDVGFDMRHALFSCQYEANASPTGCSEGLTILNNGIQKSQSSDNNYFHFMGFRFYNPAGNYKVCMMEIHANCSLNPDAVGKPIIQFPANFHFLEGLDQTPFMLDGHELMIDQQNKTLVYLNKIERYNSSGACPNDCHDAKMI